MNESPVAPSGASSAEEKRRLLAQKLQERMARGVFPLSFSQQRLWFLHRMDPGSPAYNIPLALRARGELDIRVLRRALRDVVRRHEALRTTFTERDGRPVQVVARSAPDVLVEVDLRSLSAADREGELRRLAHDAAARPFDLERGPLLRATAVRVDDGKWGLLFTLHHVVADGWSMGVLVRDLSAIYAAHARDEEPALAPIGTQYPEFALWQRGWLKGSVVERETAFWRAELDGAPRLLEVPTDCPRPAVAGPRGDSRPVALEERATSALRALARAEGATLFMSLMAAWQLLLGRYAGQDDVLVGTPIAGRTRQELEGAVGFFVNTLVIRARLQSERSFRCLLRQVRETTLGAYAHQHLPFEKLVEELGVERSLAHTPLVQAVFALENNERTELALGGARFEPLEGSAETARFDLTLTLAESDGAVSGAINYRAELWDGSTMERMAAHLERVLEQVAADPDAPLSSLSLVDGDERRMLVHTRNQTGRPYPRDICLHDLFASHAAARPDAVALEWDDTVLTYAQLDARANQLAQHLRALRVGPETRVGLLMERGVDLVVSLLAILKAGGAYVPLDPSYPAERLRLMVADAAIPVVLTHRAFAASIAGSDAAIVALDEAADVIATLPTDAPVSGAVAENLAYIVYTSGSTGRPKGVMVNHRTVVQLVVETDYVRLGPGDRIAQASNASFDALAFEAWGAFLNGATLVGIGRDVLLSAGAMRAFLREKRITTLYQTTALLNQLSREQPDLFQPVREVLFGGQAADAEAVRRVIRAGKPGRLLHMYGPTETTAWCSAAEVRHVDDDAQTVSVGRATGNQRIYLLDGEMNLVPVGLPGEAYVGGSGVVRGYLDRPALTAERFVPDPFGTEPGARMYRTGDRLRWKADGTLEFMGRLDAQVKIRGFRIEPGEVEAALSAETTVREVRVVVREDVPGEKRLVAYVVGPSADGEALRASLRQSMPEYMVPAAVVVIDRLPLTPNGKLDVRALHAPALGGGEDAHVAPRTPTETLLAGIWSDVLQTERISVADSFFELGGHSLLATRVVSRVREVFGIELPLRALFESPTVAGLATAVEALRRAGAPAPPALMPVERGEALPLSFAQERLWFLDRLQPGSALYNVPSAVRLRGPLEVAALERALGEIVRRHESLRTTFTETSGAPVQVIAPFDAFALPVEDLSSLAPSDREVEVKARASDDAARPFDLAAGPLFRASLLRLADDEHVLLLCMHHVVSDGWSMGVLLRDLSALYAAFRDGTEPDLPALPVQYADFAVWQRERLGHVLEAQLDWWKARLAGAPALLPLPTDRPRPPVQTYAGATVRAHVDAALAERLRTLGRREGATLFMVLLAAFQVLLSRHGAGDDMVVGSPIAGRTRRETEGLIGFFVNTLVLRTDLSGQPSFREVLRRVRDVTLGAYEHQDVPFEKLVEELQPERSLNHSPLFQVLFTLDSPGADSRNALPGLRMEAVETELEAAKFDLTLGVSDGLDGLDALLQYNVDLFDRTTAERMLAHLARLLGQVVDDADLPISSPSLLSAEERRIIDGWNATDARYPTGLVVPDLFGAQAARTPDAPALVLRGETLTYAELDERANRLANHLRRHGVGPESCVGVCLERTPGLIAALLAAHKAGGAYVPLDPAYPRERLGYMMEDAGVRLVLTSSALADRLPSDANTICLDAIADTLAGASAEAPESGVSPENLSHVIFTSGSTGRPKGVMIRHASVVVLLHWMRANVSDEERSAVLASTSINFDVSVAEIFGTLCWGGTLVLVENALDLPSVADQQIRYASMVPTAAAELLRAGGIPASVRTLNLGGEALPNDLAQAIYATGTVQRVMNAYGPTEDTTYSTVAEVRKGADRVRIGRPLANTRTYVLDDQLRSVPVGIIGELYLAGDGLSRGYASRPGLTAERFIPDPFGAPGARMYRVMDRVRWTADGELEYFGRTDTQVKVRGFRIELGEIEATLRAHPLVQDAVAVVREDAPGDRRIVAYLVAARGGEAPPAADLRAHLKGHLPEYMVPSAFVALGALPLTPNGKVDRNALPAPDRAASDEGYVAPRTRTEAALAAIWTEVLRAERVGIHDDFFGLGGHSLLAVRIMARIRESLGVDLPLRALFEVRTVAALAVHVDAAAPLDPAVPAITAEPRVEHVLAGVGEMSEEELDRLLGALSDEEPGS